MTALTEGDRTAVRNAAATVRHYVPGGRENGGGIGRMVGYISSTAKEAGETHLVTDTRGPRWSLVTSPMRMLSAILMMAKDRIIAPARIHHIHIAGRGSTTRKLILTEAARLLGCSHILHLHDYDYASDFAARSPRQQMLIRRMFQHADQVVALGQRDRVTLTTLLGVDERRVAVIRNCVPDPGARSVHVGKMPLIVFLGRLSERKGVGELLLALSHPIMKALQWRAVLAGDGPVEDYRRQAAALGLSDLVKMPGWLGADEAQALCARADILVLPSHAEGLAMAVVEGLAHGLAVVTTRVGAHGEVISDGETGIFVPVGDKDALAAALAKLVSDPEIRNRLSAKARAHYLNQFSMKAYMRSLEKLYDAVSAQPQTSVGER
ncbi:glycosyltransferase involved in cell wall biosynthesis [Rhizobium aethiopicum]|uniref:Glycosyltransferase involved in cell wall biosynthesis n=2 Tax=Rhizobium aethiopicum TaxID=1138170 RepID=A0A7W6Q715_9HYPH|nr:glycosyltransferase involved in cell wall biosynthesis [Rhizobium aethiopicum]MBB4578556.1 glycosyltransferase involved in cell wall biosynthesis [Rhizobium aethiopicum]